MGFLISIIPPSIIAKWISTRKAGRYLSGMSPINNEAHALGIKKTDVASFERALSKCSTYSSTIYRGVFLTDSLYNTLITKGVAVTQRYYSFAKTKEWAEAYGNKIVIVIVLSQESNSYPVPVFDISKYSRESEIILGKNITLYLENIEKDGLFTYVNVKLLIT